MHSPEIARANNDRVPSATIKHITQLTGIAPYPSYKMPRGETDAHLLVAREHAKGTQPYQVALQALVSRRFTWAYDKYAHDHTQTLRSDEDISDILQATAVASAIAVDKVNPAATIPQHSQFFTAVGKIMRDVFSDIVLDTTKVNLMPPDRLVQAIERSQPLQANGIEQEISEDAHQEQVVQVLAKTLKFKEQRLMELYYGLAGEKPHSTAEIAQHFGIGTKQCEYIRRYNLYKLRKNDLTAVLQTEPDMEADNNANVGLANNPRAVQEPFSFGISRFTPRPTIA